MKEKLKKLPKTAGFQCVIIALILDVILEILGRHSVLDTFRYIGAHPFIYLYNCSIIFFTLTLALLIRKRLFGYCFITIIWLAFGITNSVVLGFRITPFSAIDILMTRSTLTIIDKYLTVGQIATLGVGLFAALAVMILLFIKSPTVTGNIYRIRTTIFIVATFICVMLFTRLAINTKAISDNFANLATAYDRYGFAYCFSNSVVDVGIKKPDDYSEEKMAEIGEILDNAETSNAPFASHSPNVIIIQLESFMDPSHVVGLKMNQDPVPNFTKLKAECTSGFLSMPAIGAGTANSEFELLTGFNVDYFGAGEYPYKTVLGYTSCESLATEFKNMGYSTHAIHNHDGTFYDRYNVYSYLGFDTFTPKEYIYGITHTPKYWEKDDVLPGEIFKAMNSTDERDFVFTVSVQGHGKYPTTIDRENYDYPIDVKTGTGDEILDTQWTYYCNMLHEMDEQIGRLIDRLKEFDEPVVVVMYGDHLPGFEFTNDSVDNGDLYQTEYFIWSNMDNFPVEDEDLQAYQLGTKLFDMIGFPKATLQKFHSLYKIGDEGYDDILKNIEYDMLYGDRYLFPDGWPYGTNVMTYGIQKIEITGIEPGTYTYVPGSDGGDDGEADAADPETLTGFYIHGRNFNEFSYVWINNGYKSNTIYIDRNTLFYPGDDINPGMKVYVAQGGSDSVDIGRTDGYLYEGDGEDTTDGTEEDTVNAD